jgi:hypothetical protein
VAALVVYGIIFVYLKSTLVKDSPRRSSDESVAWGNIFHGQDGRPSTSKAQLLFWSLLVIWAYVAVFTRRSLDGSPLGSIMVPRNLLILMGFSVGTAVSAKAVTIRYRHLKSARSAAEPYSLGSLIADDAGRTALEKAQLVAWTLVAGGIFVYMVVFRLFGSVTPKGLPDVDGTLLLLTGISHAGYVASKAVAKGGETKTKDLPPSPVFTAGGGAGTDSL